MRISKHFWIGGMEGGTTDMQELKKADIRIEMVPKYVIYECPHCGNEVEADYSDFEDERMSDYWTEWEGDTVICNECGAEFEIGNVEVD